MCGQPALQGWFVTHALMVLTGVLLSTLGVALAIKKKGTDPLIKADLAANPHPVLGIVALVLMYAQLPMAALRPRPDHPNRPVFNAAHWGVGNVALLFAVAAIFLGGSLNALPIMPTGSYVTIVFAFCAVHVAAHLALMVNRHFEARGDLRNKTSPQPQEEIPAAAAMTLEVEEEEAKASSGNARFRWVVFVVYAAAAFGFAIALSAMIGGAANGRQSWW